MAILHIVGMASLPQPTATLTQGQDGRWRIIEGKPMVQHRGWRGCSMDGRCNGTIGYQQLGRETRGLCFRRQMTTEGAPAFDHLSSHLMDDLCSHNHPAHCWNVLHSTCHSPFPQEKGKGECGQKMQCNGVPLPRWAPLQVGAPLATAQSFPYLTASSWGQAHPTHWQSITPPQRHRAWGVHTMKHDVSLGK